MARKWLLVDDLDNRESTEENPVETISFSYRGQAYTIDLSARNAAAFDKTLSKYVDAASLAEPPVPPAPARRTRKSQGKTSAQAQSETAEIRAWAVARGLMAEGSRGRIPTQIVAQYREEQGQGIPPAPGETAPAA